MRTLLLPVIWKPTLRFSVGGTCAYESTRVAVLAVFVRQHDRNGGDPEGDVEPRAIRSRCHDSTTRGNRVLPYQQHAPGDRCRTTFDPDLAAGARDREARA